MSVHEFQVILADKTDLSLEEADALYAHCKDGTLVTAGGVTYLDFDREAHSLEEAVRSAIADIHAAGFRATRVEIDACTFSPQQV